MMFHFPVEPMRDEIRSYNVWRGGDRSMESYLSDSKVMIYNKKVTAEETDSVLELSVKEGSAHQRHKAVSDFP
jgi:hypothetical protein